jgi:hypothetical protein
MCLNDKISEYNNLIDSLLEKNKAHPYFLACEQMSRNLWTTSTLEKHINNKVASKLSASKFMKSLLRYYFANLLELIMITVSVMIFKFTLKPIKINLQQNKKVLQSFFLEKKIISDKYFKDAYFSSLYEQKTLSKENSLLIGFYISDSFSFNNRLKVADALLRFDKNAYPDFYFLSVKDILSCLLFLLAYPLHHYRYKPDSNSNLQKLLINDLYENIHQIRINAYIKFLVGRKLGKILPAKSNVLSWYENQVSHKLFIKGLRSSNAHLKVNGAQLLLFPLNMVNYYPTLAEKRAGIIPDKLFYNGKFFLNNSPEHLREISQVGPSLRYESLFDTHKSSNRSQQTKVLIALPYLPEQSEKLLTLCMENLNEYPCILRIHPANTKIRDLVDVSLRSTTLWEAAKGSLYENLSESWLLITSGSGVAVEAIASGVKVLIFNKDDITASYLPDVGQHEVWDYFDNGLELVEKIKIFRKHDQNESKKDIYAKWYSDNLFTQNSKTLSEKLFD